MLNVHACVVVVVVKRERYQKLAWKGMWKRKLGKRRRAAPPPSRTHGPSAGGLALSGCSPGTRRPTGMSGATFTSTPEPIGCSDDSHMQVFFLSDTTF
ncbi:hypothetical protein CSOJ01_12432 [Colletotrichum sojae]|uniref:Uncharacterized protein n=1 Tax=Colletotrichum sojae TaxID=2175907 RepID=A0A8H6MMC9_9PEZI|nr:hypothetical protein CSOJ01_12432 [Colletotrichum sojae]